jgi:formylglycine-generating enzyme required for sulfatase activity
MKFIRIDPGSFEMGLRLQGTVHAVSVTQGYYLQVTEVTEAQWQAVMGSAPTVVTGPDRPAQQVSWDDTQEFFRRLNAKEKDTRYSLPSSEAWEYACRAGDNGTNAEIYADEVHPVAQTPANAWGIYDMRGNVLEWVQDCFRSDCTARTVRGGSSALAPGSEHFRCSFTYGRSPDARSGGIETPNLPLGFRSVKAF